MKHLFYLLILIFISSCGNEKPILLPETTASHVHEVLDISPAYLFYDITKPDSLELNRKNLISTTNWLVNVDKRLRLQQAIPQIQFLQDKKKNSSHKKEGVKNYYTCNDIGIKNLGFIEFTEVNYKTYLEETEVQEDKTIFDFNIFVNSLDDIIINSFLAETVHTKDTLMEDLISEIHTTIQINYLDLNTDSFTVHLNFNRNLNFQDYISIKSLFLNLEEGPMVSNNEYIY